VKEDIGISLWDVLRAHVMPFTFDDEYFPEPPNADVFLEFEKENNSIRTKVFLNDIPPYYAEHKFEAESLEKYFDITYNQKIQFMKKKLL